MCCLDPDLGSKQHKFTKSGSKNMDQHFVRFPPPPFKPLFHITVCLLLFPPYFSAEKLNFDNVKVLTLKLFSPKLEKTLMLCA